MPIAPPNSMSGPGISDARTKRMYWPAMRREVAVNRFSTASSRLYAFTTRWLVKLSCMTSLNSAVCVCAARQDFRSAEDDDRHEAQRKHHQGHPGQPRLVPHQVSHEHHERQRLAHEIGERGRRHRVQRSDVIRHPETRSPVRELNHQSIRLRSRLTPIVEQEVRRFAKIKHDLRSADSSALCHCANKTARLSNANCQYSTLRRQTSGRTLLSNALFFRVTFVLTAYTTIGKVCPPRIGLTARRTFTFSSRTESALNLTGPSMAVIIISWKI